MPAFLRCVLLASFLAVAACLSAAVPQDFAVDLKATVSDSVPRLVLNWTQRLQSNIVSQTLHRRLKGESTWIKLADLTPTATTYADTTALAGIEYEYWMERALTGLTPNRATGYLSAGVKVPAVHDRGILLLVIDDTLVAPLAEEITQLRLDLTGDGWLVQALIAPRSGTALEIKALIQAAYAANPAQVKQVYVLGHVPVPYSGNLAPDGHSDHTGAWAADGYYGEMDGIWTDTSVNITSATRTDNHNIPGDGKFDPSQFPSLVELGVGRVDMYRLGRSPSAISATPEVEISLLRRYLQKAHEFRHKKQRYANIPRRTLIRDGFGHAFNSEPFAMAAWAGAYTGVGHPPASPIDAAPSYGWFLPAYAGAQDYLWGHGGGGGTYQSASSFGNSTDLGHKPSRVVFTTLFGSYHGDWGSDDNLLRSVLAGNPDGDSLGLCAFWTGRPHFFVHHLGMGETLGFMTRESMNAGLTGGGGYVPSGSSSRGIHLGLMGDPALRLHQVEPPRRLAATSASGQVSLSWAASTESGLQGYHIYRAATVAGPFAPLTPTAQIGTSYTDTTVSTGTTYTYLVRTSKLDEVPGGTYYNLSVGTPVTITVASSTAAPHSPSDLTLVSQSSAVSAQLAWQDNGSTETSYRIERKVNTGSWTPLTTLPANSTSHTDTGPFSPLSAYFYRVIAVNAQGDSPASNVAWFEACAGFVELSERGVIVSKSAGTATIAVKRFGGATGAVSVSFATSNASATAGTHYTSTSGSLTWADGEAGEKNIVVPLNADTTPRQARQFSITLTNPTNGARLGVFNRNAVLVEDSSATLPATWQQSFIGTAPSYPYGTTAHSSLAVEAEGAIGSTMVGGSLGVGSTSDAGRFIYQQRTGDGSITAYISTPSPNNTAARMALMIRENLTAGSLLAGTATSSSSGAGGYGTKLITRASTTLTETPAAAAGNSLVTPCWVRLTRTGLNFKAEHSTDGTTWTTVGQTVLTSMANTAYWGLFNTAGDLAVASDYSVNYQLSTFANVSFSALPPPATPQNFTTASVTNTAVNLSWSSTDFTSGYRIERRGDDGTLEIIADIPTATTLSFTDTTVMADTAYQYRIVAYSSSGDSPWSAPIVIATDPPDVVSQITTDDAGGADAAIRYDSPNTPLGTQTNLPVTATAPPSNNVSTIAKTWLRFDLGAFPTLKSAQLKVAYVGDENMAATFAAGGSDYFKIVPHLLLEESDTWDETTLTWNNAPQNGLTGISIVGSSSQLNTNFYYYSAAELPAVNEVVSIPLNATALQAGRGANNRVTIALVPNVVNAGGMLWASREHPTLPPPTLEITTPSPIPCRPGFLTLTPGAGSSQVLTWMDITSTEIGFQIERRVANGEWSLLQEVAAGVTTFTDTTALAGVIYDYRIRATTATGPSTWATVSTLTHTSAARVTRSVTSLDGSTYQFGATPAGNALIPTGLTYYPPAQTFASSVSLSAVTVRNNLNTWRGMQITVGTRPIVIHELARWVLVGNTGTHTVKIVDAATSQDVPGASVQITTLGTRIGFKYAALATPVTLAAGASYWIVSQELNGGDTWYDGNCTLTYNGTVAQVNQAVYSDGGGVYTLSNAANNTYIPLNFKSTFEATPYLTQHRMTTLRNDVAGWLGMEFTTGTAPLQVTQLGRWIVPGNTGTHAVRLVEADTGTLLGSVSIATAGAPADQIKYAPLPAPLPLAPQTRYYLLSQETAGGDLWYSPDTPAPGTTSAFRTWLLSNGMPMDLAVDGDFDTDGVTNFIEFALALPPASTSYDAHLTHGTIDVSGQTYLTLTYRRPEPAPANISYTVEAITALTPTGWSSTDLVQVSSTVTAAIRTITVRDSTPLTPNTKRFMRLRVRQL